ncbi:MAG: hypothetical protein ACO1SX_00960 [Actinomycetota bacterium]
MDLDTNLLIALVVLHLIAIADVWTSRLSRSAKVLWTVNLIFLVGVGFASWLLTRHTAHQVLAEVIPGGDHEPLT